MILRKLVIAPALLVAMSGVSWRAEAQYTAVVNPNFQFQTLEGFGTSLAWWANGVGAWSDPARTDAVDAIFAAPPYGLGLTFARYNIGGGDCPTCDFIIYPEADPSYQPTPDGPFVYTADANQQWVAERAYADGVDLIDAGSFSPPYWMTISGSSTGGEGGAPNLSSSYQGTGANQFPTYLATVAGYFHSNLGITFREMEPFNEPDGNYWVYGNTQEGSGFTTAQEQTVIQNTATELASLSPLTSVVANDDNSINDAYSDLTSYSSTTMADLTQLDTHAYQGTERSLLQSFAASAGKRMVESEWGSWDTTGSGLSSELTADMRQMRPVDWAIWQPYWPGLETISDFTDQTYTPLNEVYYVYGNYSEFIRPGYIFVNISDGNSLAAYNGHTDTLVIVTMNWTSGSVPVTYDLTNFSSLGTSAQGYQTSSNQNLANIGTVSISSGVFTSTLPADSVTTWVISGAEYSPAAVTHYNDTSFTYSSSECGSSWCYGTQSGAYNGDNHWAAVPGDYYTFTFTGTQARVYGTFNDGMGITAYSVDGGAETDVDQYTSSNRVDDALVYSTPTLPYGSHTIKARATGLVHSGATSNVSTADRIDVVNNGISSSGWFTMVNSASGMCLTDPGGSATWGTLLEQETCVNGATDQEWQFQPASNGYYTVVNGAAQSVVWDVEGASLSEGSQIDLWGPTGGSNQLWLATQLSDGVFTFSALNSAECLSDPNYSTKSGQAYIQWPCANSSYDEFTLTQVATGGNLLSNPTWATGSESPWITWVGTGSSSDVKLHNSNGYAGDAYRLGMYDSSAYDVSAYQDVTGQTDGATFTASVFAWTSSSSSGAYLQVRDNAGGTLLCSVSIPVTSSWKQYSCSGTVDSTGALSVNLVANEPGGQWVTWDNAKLTVGN